MKRVALALALLAACGPRGPSAPAVVAVAVPFELHTLDPHAEDKLSSVAILCNVYEPLVTTDAGMDVRPALAESWESPDPQTWVFRLRPGVRFHGGRTLRAADVVYSFRRILGRQDLEIRNYLADVERVEAVGDGAVRIRTRVPTRVLLNRLSHVFVVPEGQNDEALRGAADGTGAYRLAEWEPGRRVRLVRHEGHWNGPAPLATVDFHLARSPEDAIGGLLAGQYQLVRGDSRKLQAAVGDSPRFVTLRQDNLFVKYLAFDLARDETPFCSVRPNPFKDLRVRRALHMGLDRHRLVKELWNYAVPATQPVPRFVFGFDPGIPEPASDPEAARALLREAGLAGGFHVVLHARKVVAEAARLVAEDLRGIGIRAEPREVSDAEFFGLVGRRGATLWVNRFGCLTGDATEFLYDVVHSSNPERHFGSINYGGHADGALDRAIEAIASVDEADDRRNAIQEVLRKVMDDLVVIPLYNDQDVYAMDRTLSWRPRSDSNMAVAEIGLRR